MRRFGLAVLIAALCIVSFSSRAYAAAADDQDCEDFSSQASAQQHLRADPSDPDKLDPDHDGIACETNQAPYDTVPVQSNTTVSRQPASTTTTTTTIFVATTTTVASDLANSGPHPYAWLIAAAGVVALVAGRSMRGQRAAGSHWQ